MTKTGWRPERTRATPATVATSSSTARIAGGRFPHYGTAAGNFLSNGQRQQLPDCHLFYIIKGLLTSVKIAKL